MPAHLLLELSQLISRQMGLHFAKDRWGDIERGMYTAAKEFGFEDATSCAGWLLSTPLTRRQIEVLASHLTVGETYFFRDRQIFETLETRIFLELINQRRGGNQSLRVWSAGCASGEEPYSIAILLRKMIPDIMDWNITVLGSDINPRFLLKAEEGIYTDWSFRDVPPLVKEMYFRKTAKGQLEILPAISRIVTFAYLNLVEDYYPSLFNVTNAMDVIFLRNVLMYFSPDVQRKVIRKMHGSLVEGGWLIVSPSESSNQLFPEFAAVNRTGFTFYRKDSSLGGTAAVIPPFSDENMLGSELLLPTPDVCFEMEAGITVAAADAVSSKTAESPMDVLEKVCALYGQGRCDEVTNKAVSALLLKVNDAKHLELLARSFANQGKLAEAAQWCEKALVAAKLDPGCHYLLATILQEQGKDDEATAALKRALYLDQDFALAHFTLGNLARRRGKPEEATRCFNNALSLLKKCAPDDLVTVGRMIEIIENTIRAVA